MTEISKEQARKMQETIDNKRNATLFPGMDLKKEVKVEANQYSDILALLRIRFQEGTAIYLKGNIPSKKNSKEIMSMFTGKSECCNSEYDRKTKICSKCGKTTKSGKRPVLHNSKVVQEYIEQHADDYNKVRPLFLELTKNLSLPIQLGVYFIRDSNRKFDIGNVCQIITDLMKDHFLIPDDDSTNISCVFLGFHVDKNKPGCIIKVIDNDKFKEQLIKLI
jgi:hypothetical protein